MNGMENFAEKVQWKKWGTIDGRIGKLPDFVCIPPEFARIYFDAFWDAFLETQTGKSS